VPGVFPGIPVNSDVRGLFLLNIAFPMPYFPLDFLHCRTNQRYFFIVIYTKLNIQFCRIKINSSQSRIIILSQRLLNHIIINNTKYNLKCFKMKNSCPWATILKYYFIYMDLRSGTDLLKILDVHR